MNRFETNTKRATGRRKHQARRVSAEAHVLAIVLAKEEENIEDSIEDAITNEGDAENLQQPEEEEEPSKHTSKKKESSDWKKAKKVLTKVTKKIVGKQAEMLFFNNKQQ